MSMPDLIKEIVKVDDYTVKFVLNRPEAPMLANLAMDFASMLSAEYADKLEADGKMEMLNQKPVGTGPFQFVAYQKDAVIRYQAFADYWGGKQPIDNLIFAITTDASVRLQKLKAGECHVMPYPAPADIADIKADANLNLMEQEGLNVGYLAYNTQMAPFDNPKVRKALNMAINKQAILDAVFQGAGQAAKNPIPPTMWSYNEDVQDDAYDPEAAKKMLEEAGVTDLKMKIWAMPVQRPYNPNARRMAEVIQADFAKSASRSRSFPTNGASTSSAPRKRTATAPCCSAGPVTMAIRTTSSPCCSVVTALAVPTARSGATSRSRT
jgi:dipeptide transport system substrate-binding protein